MDWEAPTTYGREMHGSRSRTSAGLLVYRRREEQIDVLLVHPGGPFFARKDAGAWSVPKGEAFAGEDLIARARIEFLEELGIEPPHGEPDELGSIKQKGGKTVYVWTIEGDLPPAFQLRSNHFALEWPPRSGRTCSFPEVDRAEFFPLEVAREKINPAQVVFLDRLVERAAKRPR
jgi:predicted NUDIX family NTP pyrophosphohydrolase